MRVHHANHYTTKASQNEQVLNIELQRVHSWLNANRLSLNVKKTKNMLFHKHKSTEIGKLNLRISKDGIQSVNEGQPLFDTITFAAHIFG